MKIIICDDQAVVRDGLELLLSLEKERTFRSSAARRMAPRLSN